MSTEVMALVLRAKIGNAAKKSVLKGLAEHAAPDGTRCFPSVRRITAYTELSESTVRQKLSELRDDDELIHIVAASSGQRPTEYRIDIEKLRYLEHPYFAGKRNRTPTYGGKTPPRDGGVANEPLQETEGTPPGAGGEDLRELEGTPPGAGGRTIIKPSFEPSEEPDDFQKRILTVSKNRSQTEWIQVLAAIQQTHYRGRNGAGSEFKEFWEPTYLDTRNGDRLTIACRDEDQRAWLQDRRGIAESQAIGVLGARPTIEFVCRED